MFSLGCNSFTLANCFSLLFSLATVLLSPSISKKKKKNSLSILKANYLRSCLPFLFWFLIACLLFFYFTNCTSCIINCNCYLSSPFYLFFSCHYSSLCSFLLVYWGEGGSTLLFLCSLPLFLYWELPLFLCSLPLFFFLSWELLLFFYLFVTNLSFLEVSTLLLSLCSLPPSFLLSLFW